MRKSSLIRATDAGPLEGPGAVSAGGPCCDDWYSSWSYINPASWTTSDTVGIGSKWKPLFYSYKVTIMTGAIITMPYGPTRSDLLLNLGIISEIMGGGVLAKIAFATGVTGQMTLHFGRGYQMHPWECWLNPVFAIKDGLVPGVDETLGLNGACSDLTYPVPDNTQITTVFNDCAAGGLDIRTGTVSDRAVGWAIHTIPPIDFAPGTTVVLD